MAVMIVRKLRLERGFSQEQLASMAGVSVRTLQRMERGANPSAETLKCLAAVLETDISTLRKERDMTTAADIPHLSDDERDAMEYVRDIRGFYIHAVQYVVVIAGLAAINLLTSPGYLWFLWAALGWGVAVTVHGLGVFEIVNLFGDGWERRQVARRLARSRQSRGQPPVPDETTPTGD